ncbi:MAG TPA: hypothetical protein VIF62_39490 [Labilithrix sp.]|jgi:hypothetical protein
MLFVACDPPPPVKNAHGERIDKVELREEFATSDDPREVSWSGDALRKAVELMDKRGVFDMSGSYAAKETMHQATLVLVAKTTDGKERRIEVKDCAEPKVCGFLADMEAAGKFERRPVVCRSTNSCTH